MLETILTCAGVLLALYGLVGVIRSVVFYLLTSRHDGEQALLVRLRQDDAEAELRAAMEKLQMYGSKVACVIIGVDCGLDEETLRICRIISKESGNVRLCKPEELAELMKTEFTQQLQDA